MIHGKVQGGVILPLEPVPVDWDGREVVIEAAAAPSGDERAMIDAWFDRLEALGPAQYEPGEREAVERFLRGADDEAKAAMRRGWARFDDILPA